jgi:hypothetical protein
MNNLKRILTTKSDEKVTTWFVQWIGILDQFRIVVKQGREEQEREDVQERGGEEREERGED